MVNQRFNRAQKLGKKCPDISHNIHYHSLEWAVGNNDTAHATRLIQTQSGPLSKNGQIGRKLRRYNLVLAQHGQRFIDNIALLF